MTPDDEWPEDLVPVAVRTISYPSVRTGRMIRVSPGEEVEDMEAGILSREVEYGTIRFETKG